MRPMKLMHYLYFVIRETQRSAHHTTCHPERSSVISLIDDGT